ncbi:MAG: hypothetical protein JWQ97_3630 [Phenylobacterium sp.]|nr:hypothetical protein [Phenylobacterium sp.]
MRDTPEGIVEELRDSALVQALELDVPKESLTEWEAAEHIVHLRGQLQRIAEGETPAREIAAEALDPTLWALGED